MEPNVLSQILSTPYSRLFDPHQLIDSSSGSGNNWANGHHHHAPIHREAILDAVRIEAERCESLQSFFTISSLGGGTGSGVGSAIQGWLKDLYPEQYTFATAVLPGPMLQGDDVVTSPYNAMLALGALDGSVDCVLPVENPRLMEIVEAVVKKRESVPGSRGGSRTATAGAGFGAPGSGSIVDNGTRGAYGGLCGGSSKKPHPFERMNNIVANLLMNLTSSMRFDGCMNVDISDIVTNLVPFPRQKWLVSSMSPLWTSADLATDGSHALPRRLDQMFTDAFSKDSQLIKADPKVNT
ncbi:Tubulin epsilon chain [Irineochytrium annulatum]|nr:Tubulin epsilon chain [Irineochytrium annulatum]